MTNHPTPSERASEVRLVAIDEDELRRLREATGLGSPVMGLLVSLTNRFNDSGITEEHVRFLTDPESVRKDTAVPFLTLRAKLRKAFQ